MPALLYLLQLVLFTAIDTVWLTSMVGRIYRPWLGDILLDRPRFAPAIVFYLLYAGGLTLFAAQPAAREGGAMRAMVLGALLGLFAYGTYDLTNYATLRAWGLRITLADLAWGAILSGGSTALAVMLAPRIGRLAALAA